MQINLFLNLSLLMTLAYIDYHTHLQDSTDGYLLLLAKDVSISAIAGLLDKDMLKYIFHKGFSQDFQHLLKPSKMLSKLETGNFLGFLWDPDTFLLEK